MPVQARADVLWVELPPYDMLPSKRKFSKIVRCPGDFRIRRWVANRWNCTASVLLETIALQVSKLTDRVYTMKHWSWLFIHSIPFCLQYETLPMVICFLVQGNCDIAGIAIMYRMQMYRHFLTCNQRYYLCTLYSLYSWSSDVRDYLHMYIPIFIY